MTIRLKSKTPYWEKFSIYQTFENAKDMNAHVKRFNQMYTLTPATKAVLNTLKLHSKTFFGVCWLYKEEITKKAKVSLSSVTRALKELKAIGILTVHENMHTLRGGRTHNVYVINSTFEGFEDSPIDSANESAIEDVKEDSIPDVPTVCELEPQTHKNLNKNPNTNLKDISIKRNDVLKNIPNEFVDLMKPFYANDPEIIRDRWVTVCVAVKKSCKKFKFTSWDTIGQAWKDTVHRLKLGRIKNATNDGIGGYFYGILCDYMLNDWLRSQFA